MSPFLGQPVLVENKSGAAGVTGVDFVAKAGSDAPCHGPDERLGRRHHAEPDAQDAVRPGQGHRARHVWWCACRKCWPSTASSASTISRASSPHAKANPGKVTCGSAGTGGITHLAIELFKRETGIDILHVPYRGAAPATNDLLAGTVDTVLLDISVLLPHVRSGAVKIAGRDLRHARAPAARRADHARDGLSQGQFRQLVRPDLAGRGAARGAPEDLRCRHRGAQDQGDRRRLCRRRRCRGRRHARPSCRPSSQEEA